MLVSTDKASAPATLYGGSKFLAERLWLGANRYSAGREPRFMAVRYGNVWGSRGSVLHAWKKQAQAGQIVITDVQCTRFHIKLEQAVSFVLDALDHGAAGELWVPKLPSYRLGDLASAFSSVYGMSKPAQVIGLRMGEKLHESMISVDESCSNTKSEPGHYVLEPGKVVDKGGWSYTSGSNTWRLSIEQLEKEIRG